MAQFDDCKIGDRVWSVQNGWGEIVDIDSSLGYSLQVKFQNSNGNKRFALDGKWLEADSFQTLFWDEVEIVPPERPKKVCECGNEIYKNTALCLLCLQDLSKPKKECEACRRIQVYGTGTSSGNEYIDSDIVFLLDQHHVPDCPKDEGLPIGAIEQAIKDNEITEDEIVAEFKYQLRIGL